MQLLFTSSNLTRKTWRGAKPGDLRKGPLPRTLAELETQLFVISNVLFSSTCCPMMAMAMDHCQLQSCKRACMLNDLAASGFSCKDMNASCMSSERSLLMLPSECLEKILLCLDAKTLMAVSETASAFRAFDAASGLRLVDKIAHAAVATAAQQHAGRWRRRSWLSQLNIEDSGVGFASFAWSKKSSSPQTAQEQPAVPHYRFLPPTSSGSFLHIKLEGMGPKLLVSDVSTASQPLLRWRLVVRGNTAVEFGVVPVCLEGDDKALHKCQQEHHKFEHLQGQLLDQQRPTGFCSSITVGSLLPFKTAIMKGSIVELLARRGRLEILVQNPPDGQELYWHNTRTVPKPYKGPREVRFEQDFSPDHDIKLALTSWAHGAFDVLHPAPGSRVLGCEFQQAWDGSAHRQSSSDSCSSPPAAGDLCVAAVQSQQLQEGTSQPDPQQPAPLASADQPDFMPLVASSSPACLLASAGPPAVTAQPPPAGAPAAAATTSTAAAPQAHACGRHSPGTPDDSTSNQQASIL